MLRGRNILVIALVVLVAGLWYATRVRQPPPVIDLIQTLPAAEKQPLSAGPDVFAVRNERIGGETRYAIYAHPPTRITWRLTLPNDGWLRTAIGVDEQAWDKEGDGILFFIGITDLGVRGKPLEPGSHYRVLLEQLMDPHANRADRRWVPVTLDLSPYGGHDVQLMFNTRTSVKGDDPRNDFAYWGTPAICLRP